MKTSWMNPSCRTLWDMPIADALLCQGQTVGGKKGSYYRDDSWNLRYLKGLKWLHLTEQIAQENAERTNRMRAEISKAAKENKEFVRNVERAKMLEGIQAKKAAKRRRDDASGDEGVAQSSEEPRKRVMTFKQIPAANKRDEQLEQSAQVRRVLTKIF